MMMSRWRVRRDVAAAVAVAVVTIVAAAEVVGTQAACWAA
jgi:hypothetical protein